ncbi:MAG: glycogen debranching enzyme family protein [Candidatus Goldbacteria bacterium]|nr:glycogen debranching enzyme family protein [Candidatus Goldiibacteriota bacterium]
MISFGRHICNIFNFAIEKEWIITNRKGSYSSSTIISTNIRKHHGLLVAKFDDSDGRIVVFSNCEEEVDITGHIYSISTQNYKNNIVSPEGYKYLENFTLKDDTAVFLYLIDNVRLRKKIFLMKDSNTLVVTYEILTPDSHLKLSVKPFIAFREAETLLKEIPGFSPSLKVEKNSQIEIMAYMNFPPAYIYLSEGAEINKNGYWYRDFFYLREYQGGYDALEDLYNIGTIKFDLEYNNPKTIVYSTEKFSNLDINGLEKEFYKQFSKIKETCIDIGACVDDEDYRTNIRQLIETADSFEMTDREDNPVILAGYQWHFRVWFRDALAALPGLLLVPKKFDTAKKFLKNTIQFEKNGIIPLSMTVSGKDMKYASADTTLWYFYALYKYLMYTNDYKFVSKGGEIFERLTFIIQKYSEGTDYKIYKDEDDLIYAGGPGMALTWMDAMLNGVPITPRIGKVVEINALWYNAIRIMQHICEKNNLKDMAKGYKEFAERIYKSFNEKFWYEDGGYLYDYIDENFKDDSIRPNQLFAISLPFELISDTEKKQKMINTVIKDLYTSFGLRTLSYMSTSYKPTCSGDPGSQSRAMHQGTVWAWLIGPFVTAYLRTYGKTKEILSFVETVYEPFFEHTKNAGIGTISEMFDGNSPYNARGRVSHALAVAEIIRSYFEDYLLDNEKK